MRRRTIPHWLLPIVVLLATGGLYWWYVMLSPYGHILPPDPDGIYLEQQTHGLFAYATLTSPWVRWVVLGESIPSEAARLADFRRRGLDLVAAPGEQVAGKYLTLTGPQLRRFDRYERLGSRYTRERHQLVDGRQAWIYRRIEE